MKKLYQDIGKRIAKLRKENKMTQSQLAEILDISVKHVSEIERGITCLSLEKLNLLCDILSTNMDYIIRGIDTRKHDEQSVPSYIVELFNSGDKEHIQLLEEYLLIFRKLISKK